MRWNSTLMLMFLSDVPFKSGYGACGLFHSLFVASGTTKRCHPDPGFVQAMSNASTAYIILFDERDLPEKFPYELTEINTLLRNEVECQFPSIPETL